MISKLVKRTAPDTGMGKAPEHFTSQPDLPRKYMAQV
ncbi:hypothetical protein CJA_2875 [Cellvibrio japonicus Ueda107]|uniref:Uncharacterized protein n=1 Tax=Cellvibrio japonicus (strain Ueda107) TaxID=498211 RepID=B3PC61_CELJU|nr:hypothetical protein CJA_2875 [Cellvibrio japonicus Ueda107]